MTAHGFLSLATTFLDEAGGGAELLVPVGGGQMRCGERGDDAVLFLDRFEPVFSPEPVAFFEKISSEPWIFSSLILLARPIRLSGIAHPSTH